MLNNLTDFLVFLVFLFTRNIWNILLRKFRNIVRRQVTIADIFILLAS